MEKAKQATYDFTGDPKTSRGDGLNYCFAEFSVKLSDEFKKKNSIYVKSRGLKLHVSYQNQNLNKSLQLFQLKNKIQQRRTKS